MATTMFVVIVSALAALSTCDAAAIDTAPTNRTVGIVRARSYQKRECHRTVYSTVDNEILRESSLSAAEWNTLSRPSKDIWPHEKWNVCFKDFEAIVSTGRFTMVLSVIIVSSNVPCDIGEWAFYNVTYHAFTESNGTPVQVEPRTNFLAQCIPEDNAGSRAISLLPRLNPISGLIYISLSQCDRKYISQANIRNVQYWDNYEGLDLALQYYLEDIEEPKAGETDLLDIWISKAKWVRGYSDVSLNCCRVAPIYLRHLSKFDKTLEFVPHCKNYDINKQYNLKAIKMWCPRVITTTTRVLTTPIASISTFSTAVHFNNDDSNPKYYGAYNQPIDNNNPTSSPSTPPAPTPKEDAGTIKPFELWKEVEERVVEPATLVWGDVLQLDDNLRIGLAGLFWPDAAEAIRRMSTTEFRIVIIGSLLGLLLCCFACCYICCCRKKGDDEKEE